jgi:hypothetical protein
MNFNNLMNFNVFVAPTLIRIVYWVGIVFIVLGTLMGAVGGGMMAGGYGGYGGGFNPLTVLITLIAGAAALLVWRVMCEIWIVIFPNNARLGAPVERGKV